MNPLLLKRLGVAVLTVVGAAIVFAIVLFVLFRLWPHHDATPAVAALKDQRAAAVTSAAIGNQTATANRDATVHLDITAKDIDNAFDRLPPVQPAPVAGAAAQPRALPDAPVDGVRDRLNESIARANRAAGATRP